jgi:nucleoside-diphosphate-sugar epimerase
VKLSEAPLESIKMVNYVVGGAAPIASAQDLADIVRVRIPSAQIDFKVDLEIQKVVDKLALPVDDSIARKEWNWKSEYDQERIVDDFLEELKVNPERYA